MSIKLSELLSPNKVLPFYKERADYKCEDLSPIAVEFHWTSRCNYNCIHCSYGQRREVGSSVPIERLSMVVDDLISMGVKAVYLSGGGEPTMLPEWTHIAKKFQDAGVEVALVTNGVALSAAELSILRKMNYVAVSIYSTDVDQYHKITGSRYYDVQWQIPDLIKSDESNTLVGARCVINNINYSNIVDIYEKARSSGYDYLIFVPAVDYEGTGMGLTTTHRHAVIELLMNADFGFDPDFTNVLGVLKNNISHYNLEDGTSIIKSFLCSSILIRANAFVNYCGGVWLCQPDIGNPLYKIGDIKDQTFSQIWNSHKHLDVMRILSDRYQNGGCHNCRSMAYNKAIDANYAGLDLAMISCDPFL